MTKKKKRLILINFFLIAGIIVILYNKFFTSEIDINCNYGDIPHKLLDIIDKEFYKSNQGKIKLINIFNNLPSLVDIEVINKISKIYKESIRIFSIFHKKFKSSLELKFRHKFLTKFKIKSYYNNSVFDKNYFILLKDDSIVHIENDFELKKVNFLIQKNIYPNLRYKDYAISFENLKSKIMKSLRMSSFYLLDLYSNELIKSEILSNYLKIYFIHSNCSSCELKKIFSRLSLKRIIDDDKIAIILSVYASSSEVLSLVDEYKIDLPIYIDVNDEFNLISVITENEESFFVFDYKDLGVKK